MRNLNTLQFGVIGLGRFGQHYVRILQNLPGVRLSATASRTTETSAEEIFRNPRIDCVVIASPATTHFSLAKLALKHGKHVLLEKPMVLSLKEASNLAAVVDKSGRVFMVGHQFLYNDHIRELKRRIGAGELGELRNIFAEHLYALVREDVGVFWDAGPHELAIIDYLFGPSDAVSAKGKALRISGAAVEDFVFADVGFANKISLSLLYSSIAPLKSHRLLLVGSKSIAFYDDVQAKEQEPLGNQLEHFIDCVANNKTPLTDIKHGVRVVKNLEFISAHLWNYQ